MLTDSEYIDLQKRYNSSYNPTQKDLENARRLEAKVLKDFNAKDKPIVFKFNGGSLEITNFKVTNLV